MSEPSTPPVAIAHEAVDLLRKLVDQLPEHDFEHYVGDCVICAAVSKARALLATPTASDRPVVRAEDAKDAALKAAKSALGHAIHLRVALYRNGDADGDVDHLSDLELARQDKGYCAEWVKAIETIDTVMADRAAPPAAKLEKP